MWRQEPRPSARSVRAPDRVLCMRAMRVLLAVRLRTRAEGPTGTDNRGRRIPVSVRAPLLLLLLLSLVLYSWCFTFNLTAARHNPHAVRNWLTTMVSGAGPLTSEVPTEVRI